MMPASVESIRKTRIDLSGWPGTMSNSLPPEPRPAATGGLEMPKTVGFRCDASRSSPEFRAGPSGLWQWAQLISSQARARASSVPLLGSSQTANFGAWAAGGAPESAPWRVQCSSWFSTPEEYAKSRFRCLALGPIGVTVSPALWHPLHWLALGMM